MTGGLNLAANLAQKAVGVDDQQVRDELGAVGNAIGKATDFVVNGDYAQAAKNVHQAAVDETSKAMSGDVTATANLTQVALGAMTLRGGASELGAAGKALAANTGKAVDAVSAQIANAAQAARNVIAVEGRQLATAEKLAPSVQRSVAAVPTPTPEVLPPPPPKIVQGVGANSAGPSLEIAPYGEMVKTPGVGQAHHLNQDAAFRDVIKTNDGLAIRLEGNAFTEVGSPHYNAHNSLEGFFNQFRKGGEFYREVPTNLQYSKALLNSLKEAGLSREEALEAVRASISQRVSAGQLGGLEIPRVPGKLNQTK
ncbi:MAG: hypothetical protein HOO97_06090 [Sideroxydans sp.]|nr:hypothetical protein [Sideroxydans sp.]